jgi:hypothetical protein
MIFTGSALHPVQALGRAVINIVSNARRGEALHGKLRASTPIEETAAGSFLVINLLLSLEYNTQYETISLCHRWIPRGFDKKWIEHIDTS